MFVDASALVAILCGESSFVTLAGRLRSTTPPLTSALAIVETVMAVCRKSGVPVETAEAEVRTLLTTAGIAVVSISDKEATFALGAFARYGKGRGHPAQLNLGDCFAYACARSHDVPLLFVGDEFSWTDIRSALD